MKIYIVEMTIRCPVFAYSDEEIADNITHNIHTGINQIFGFRVRDPVKYGYTIKDLKMSDNALYDMPGAAIDALFEKEVGEINYLNEKVSVI
jgi:hypothetical protein